MFRLLFLLFIGFAIGIVFTFGFFVTGWQAPSWKENMTAGYEEFKKATFLRFTDKASDSAVLALGKVLGGGEVNEKNFLESLLKRNSEVSLLIESSLPLVKDLSLKKVLQSSSAETKATSQDAKKLYESLFFISYDEGLYKYTKTIPAPPSLSASSSLSADGGVVTSLILYNKNYILLANQIIAYTDKKEVKELAEKILTSKTKEIEILKEILVTK